MGLIDGFRALMELQTIPRPPLQERSIDSFADNPTYENLLRLARTRDVPWRAASVRDALGVPAILRAVTLISNTTGALSLRAFVHGEAVDDESRPRLIMRPNPFTTPRVFFRDTAYYMATRGEAWWWVAKRDIDDAPLSLIPIHPREITVEQNPRDLRYPTIKWRGKTMANDDMRHITLMPSEDGLRGTGPLQLCGAAVSVAVEAQEWAANFFAEGGYPSIVIKSASELAEGEEGIHEADTIRAAWVGRDHNTARVIDPGIEDVKQFDPNPQGAQMLQARDYENGEAARMFSMPGSLLDYSTPGSSLTYQNVEGEYIKWIRSGLWPNYLEGIEQEMSDLLVRTTTARFNVDALMRPDTKTRWEVYDIATRVLGADEGARYAKTREGLAPGDVENSPVPYSLPQAVPTVLPIQERSLSDLHCAKCGKLAGRVNGAAEIKCRGCGELVIAA